MMAAEAYLFGYKKGEVAVETGNKLGAEVPPEIQAAMNAAFDVVEQCDIIDAFQDGVIAATYGRDCLTRQQAEILYD